MRLLEQWNNFLKYGRDGLKLLADNDMHCKRIMQLERDYLENQLLLENEVIKRKKIEDELNIEMTRQALTVTEKFETVVSPPDYEDLKQAKKVLSKLTDNLHVELKEAARNIEILEAAVQAFKTKDALQKNENLAIQQEYHEYRLNHENERKQSYADNLEDLQQSNELIEKLRAEIDSLQDKLAKTATEKHEAVRASNRLFNENDTLHNSIIDLMNELAKQEPNDIIAALRDKHATLAAEHDYCVRIGGLTIKAIIDQRNELLLEKRKREEDEQFAPFVKQARRK